MGKYSKPSKITVAILLFMNLVVLLGQVWPEGAPPFARTVNILFLSLSALFFISILSGKND